MKRSNLKKKLFFSLASFGIATSSIVATSFLAITNSSSNVSKNSTSLNNDEVATSNSTSVTGNIIPWNQDSNGNVDFNTPRQYIAFDNNKTGYAILNSSSASNNGQKTNPTFDNITKYDMTTGKSVWSKSASSLTVSGTLANGTTITSGTYLATAFLQNTLSRKSQLLSLVKGNDSKIYLVAMDWSNGDVTSITEITNGSTTQATSTSESTQYFINVNNFVNLNITISSVKISSGKVTYGKANVTSLNSSISLTSKEIPAEVTNAFNENTVLSTYYTDENNFYFVFQQNSFTASSVNNNFVTIFKIGKNQDVSSISSSNFMSLSLTSDQSKIFTSDAITEEKKAKSTAFPLVTLAEGKNKEKYLLLSQKSDSSSAKASSSYLVAKFNNNDFGSSTSVTFKTLKAIDTGYILNLSPLYSTTNEILGYIGLSTSNKAIYFSNDFSNSEIYYDFSKLSVANNGSNKIYNVFTRQNDANWYAQMTDGSIIQFSASNLIGQLDKIVNSERTEVLASVSIKEDDEIDSSIIFKSVSDSDFDSYISQNALSFLNLESYDPVFGQPKFSAEVKSKTQINGTKNQQVTIAFYQELRKRNSSGTIESTNNKVLLGTQTFTFINDNMSVTVKEKSQVSASITSKYPSNVTLSEVEEILDIENSKNYEIALQANDAFGTLTVNITSPYAWIAGTLQVNYRQSITIGSATNPYFMVDLLNGLDSSVGLVTDEYLEKNIDLKSTLSIKYSALLPSKVSKENILNDFVVLGDAFDDVQLINQGLIIKPSVDNIEVVPVDTEGYLYITITIPKVGNKQNLTYSFKSAAVFEQSATSNQNAYIVFKDTDEVKQKQITIGNVTQSLGSYLPSTIASQITNDKTWLLYFADISFYILNMLYPSNTTQEQDAKLNIITNDGLGQITISIEFNKPVQGLDGTTFKKIFDGFAKQGSSGEPSSDNNYPSFKWNDIDANAFNGKKPSDITISDLNSLNLYTLSGNASSLKKDITIDPLDQFGAIVVTVTFYNWWEKQKLSDTQSEVAVLLPEKTFQTILTNGLRQTESPSNVIVWKSYDELDSSIKNSTAANAIITIDANSSSDLEKLEKVANLSDYLITQLNKSENSLVLSITSNNAYGYIEVYAKFTIDGVTQSFGTKISGFNLESSDYVVSLASDSSEIVTSLKDYLPSQLTDEQIGSLINVQLGNNFSKRITTEYDDILGTLTIKVELIKSNSDGTISTVAPAVTRTYSGFKTNIPKYKGTNYTIVALSIVIPFVLLLSPILFILLYKNTKDVKRFSKVLDRRLSEQFKKRKNIEVNTIEDLLSIDND